MSAAHFTPLRLPSMHETDDLRVGEVESRTRYEGQTDLFSMALLSDGSMTASYTGSSISSVAVRMPRLCQQVR